MYHRNKSASTRLARLAAGAAVLVLASTSAFAGSVALPVSFLGVASGDPTSSGAVVWTRAVNEAAKASAHLNAEYTTDSNFLNGVTSLGVNTDAAADYTAKIQLQNLQSGTRYFYRFVGPNGEVSNIGTFKTAPLASADAPLSFGFSGDLDGLIRPYALASVVPNYALDFYVNLGDVIYENASASTGNNGASWLNSPSVTLSGVIPTPSSTGANQTQLFNDYSKKYREQFLPVNNGGQDGLKTFYAGQANFSLYDNHELGNKQYINGGAPAGGAVGGMPTGAGVDARLSINDVNNSASDYMNRSLGFLTLQQVFINYQPVADRGTLNVPSDPRSHGTKQLFVAQQWGKNSIFINADDRSYRDIRIKIASPAADETKAPRANNAGRTILGATQFAWLKQTLLDAQNSGVLWKFVAVSDPIDQIGPIGGALTLNNLPSFGAGGYAPVNADGGKAWIGGYRAERNALFKFIADHQIKNVVFLATDDHQNRVNELTYSPTDTESQASYIKVPYCFSIVCGPLGATGPDLISNKTFAMAEQLANSIAAAQALAGVEPLGLAGYPGLHNVTRDEDASADVNRSPVDFYSPDTFNFNKLDVTANGKTLTVTSIGIKATAQNSAKEYGADGNLAKSLFSFQIDAGTALTQITRGAQVLDRRQNKIVQQVTLVNNTGVSVIGPVSLVLDSLSGGILANSTGVTANNAPLGSRYVTVTSGNLAPGASATVVLSFNNPPSGVISYSTRAVTGTANP